MTAVRICFASEWKGIINGVFRRITPSNWAERDPINENFVMPSKLGWRG